MNSPDYDAEAVPSNDQDATEAVPRLDGQETGIRAVFTGSGEEYFRIWVVNLLLSLVTLGLFSPWATVRNRRYLYGNIELDGNRFDFHGNPIAILKGRVIAVVVFTAYAFGGDFHVLIPMVALFIMFIAFPWVLVSAMRFRLTNTSWKSLRFKFSATTRQAYMTLAYPVGVVLVANAWFFAVLYFEGSDLTEIQLLKITGVMSLVFMLLSIWVVPVLNYRIRKLVMNHIHFGDHPFSADLNQSVFFFTFLKTLGLGIVAVLAAAIVMIGITFVVTPIFSAFDESTAMYVTVALTYVIIVLVYLFPFALWQVLTSNHIISSTRVENARFKLSMDVITYWIVLLTNALLAVFTLGLAIPWTKIRMIEYKLSCFSIEGNLDSYTGTGKGSQTATGDELGEAFDIDFGF